ncbi:MFS transporter [Synoicihabitans lomoniglobus]|uniref:MFS transporter n=1 Tax=Synoicihabitans lomoniglobus TaxID=2909285 RepID=A0AAE9ZY75_9BACT|nr:MFS transporter [Opitutaceae bacterium LMO-M01]WED65200.1 MFS transporter [Opitutaceae bacterium LMO-M01]
MSVSAPTPAPLSFREKFGYGLGDTASNFVFHTINVFLFYYYTDVFGLAAGAAGTLFIVARFFDAVSDPLMGALADRTQTRWGKYRPYLLWMAVPFGIAGYLLFANPDLSASGKLIYAYITYILMMLVYTAINIPYSAMLGVITPSSQERTSLSTFRFVCAFAGQFLIVAAARPLIAKFGEGNEAAGFQATMAIFAVVAVGLFVFTFLTTRERVQPPPSQKPDLRKELGLLVRNRPWVILSIAGVLTLANVAIRGAVTVHYFKYYVGDDGTPWFGVFDLTTVFMTSGTLALIAGVACTPLFTRFAGKRSLMIWLSAANALAMASFFFIPPEATVLMLVVNILGTFIIGPTPALVWAMFADAADYGMWKLGHRSTALVFSSAQFAQKMGLTIGGGVPGIVLAYYGFVANDIQTESSLLGVRLLFTILPAAFAIGGVIAIWFYPLRESDVAQMEQDLATAEST